MKTFGIVGATGAVGIEVMKVLEKRNFPLENLRLFSSKRSAGKVLQFRGKGIVVEELTKNSFDGVNIAVFSAGGNISKEFALKTAMLTPAKLFLVNSSTTIS